MAKDNIWDEICAEVVRLLIAERKRQRISGNSLAARAGLSQSLISTMETNPWNPTFDTLLRIGEVLQVDIGAIITKAHTTVLKRQGVSGISTGDPKRGKGKGII
jgi:transcriptional regulator with XRE-family HTH domain